MDTISPIITNKIQGCLLGGAIGDALGAPIEFMPMSQIYMQYGEDGIQDYVPCFGRLGAITDDTQMTLFTAEGLLRAYVRGKIQGLISSIPMMVCQSYLRWLWTQGEDSTLPQPNRVDGWLWTFKALHHRRAPGVTCISSLKKRQEYSQDCIDNHSKGTGGLMRVAPVALFYADKPNAYEQVFSLGIETAWLTHGHPTGYLSAGAFAVILHHLVCGNQLLESVQLAREILQSEDEHVELVNMIDKAVHLSNKNISAEQAIAQIGQGWVAEEALAIAIYCALTAKNFKHGVLMAINHDGDSDTTGSLVGQLLGVMMGKDALPREWLEELELRDVIEQVAYHLATYKTWDFDDESPDYDEEMWECYPGR